MAPRRVLGGCAWLLGGLALLQTLYLRALPPPAPRAPRRPPRGVLDASGAFRVYWDVLGAPPGWARDPRPELVLAAHGSPGRAAAALGGRWGGPVSLAVFGEPRGGLQQLLAALGGPCRALRGRLRLQVVQGAAGPPPNFIPPRAPQKSGGGGCRGALARLAAADPPSYTLGVPYPGNLLRNVAWQGAAGGGPGAGPPPELGARFVLLLDADVAPSPGLREGFLQLLRDGGLDPQNWGGQEPRNRGGQGEMDPQNRGGQEPRNRGQDPRNRGAQGEMDPRNWGGQEPRNQGGQDPRNWGGQDPQNWGGQDPQNRGTQGALGDPKVLGSQRDLGAQEDLGSPKTLGAPGVLGVPNIPKNPKSLLGPKDPRGVQALSDPEVLSDPNALSDPKALNVPNALSDLEVLNDPRTLSDPNALSDPKTLSDHNVLNVPNALNVPKTLSDPNALSDPKTLSDPNALSDPKTLSDPNALNDPNAPSDPKVQSDPNALSGPNTLNVPKMQSDPKTLSDPNALNDPKTLSDPNALNDPNAPSDPNALNAPNAPSDPKAQGAPHAPRSPLSAEPPWARALFVLPAFELRGSRAPPASKAELLRLWAGGEARPFYGALCPRCQAPTAFGRWRALPPGPPGAPRLRVAYEVPWRDPWEPFFVAPARGVPPFDEGFVQYGFNRISQACELHVAGFRFAVLDGAFVTHRGWKEPGGFHRGREAELGRNRRRYREFREGLRLRYPGTARHC